MPELGASVTLRDYLDSHVAWLRDVAERLRPSEPGFAIEIEQQADLLEQAPAEADTQVDLVLE